MFIPYFMASNPLLNDGLLQQKMFHGEQVTQSLCDQRSANCHDLFGFEWNGRQFDS